MRREEGGRFSWFTHKMNPWRDEKSEYWQKILALKRQEEEIKVLMRKKRREVGKFLGKQNGRRSDLRIQQRDRLFGKRRAKWGGHFRENEDLETDSEDSDSDRI